MFGSFLLLSATLQVGPFYETRSDFAAFRPFWSHEAEKTDVLWPVFASHRDWWRFCLFTHYQEQEGGDYQFQVMPIWFNGRAEGDDYWGLFPLWGRHPHFLEMENWRFCLWPLWMRYERPRPSENRSMTSTVVMFPFVSWRDDGSWGFWPICGVGHRRESDHRYFLWPVFTWADYREDRDTAGAGTSWMFWPLCARVNRCRETQTMVLPPFFSWSDARVRAPWPIVEWESGGGRERFSLWPLYETIETPQSHLRRFGWHLVELSDRETRVFPFWVSGEGYFRLWPFWESARERDGSVRSRSLALFPIRWVDSIDRNWSKFWTFYERERNPVCTTHSLLWGLVNWRTFND